MFSAAELAVGQNKGQPHFCAFTGGNLRLQRAKNKKKLIAQSSAQGKNRAIGHN